LRLRWLGLLVVAAGGVSALALAERSGSGPETRVRFAPAPGDEGFARALEVRPFALPEDHGPHFAYQTEWWYYTGNLEDEAGRRFGFQLTFFRRGLSPGAPPADGSDYASCGSRREP